MTNEELRKRSRQMCLDILALMNSFPHNTQGWVLGKQLLRSSTSVAANYRAACCARSRAEFIAKMCVVVEEADETVFWLELIRDSKILKAELSSIIKESRALLYIFSSARKSASHQEHTNKPNDQVTK